MLDWWEWFRDGKEESRYQAFKCRFEAEQEGRELEDELQAADERKEFEKNEYLEVKRWDTLRHINEARKKRGKNPLTKLPARYM